VPPWAMLRSGGGGPRSRGSCSKPRP